MRRLHQPKKVTSTKEDYINQRRLHQPKKINKLTFGKSETILIKYIYGFELMKYMPARIMAVIKVRATGT